MRVRWAGLAAGMLMAGALAAPASASLLITVDKDAQRMTVAVDGDTRYVWPVSTGLPAYDTPNGSYRPFRMEPTHFSREWDNAPMPHAIFFSQIGHAIHGTNQTRHLGHAASHGCVRLSPRNAATLFSLVKAEKMANTRVVVEGSVAAPVASVNRDYAGTRTRGRRWRDDDDGVTPVRVQARRRDDFGEPPVRQRAYDPFAYGGADYGRRAVYGNEYDW